MLKFRIAAPLSPREFWTMRSEMSETVRTALASLDKEQQKRVEEEAIQAARPFFAHGQMSFPAKAMIVSGAKRAVGDNI
jgi:hypothetical protein